VSRLFYILYVRSSTASIQPVSQPDLIFNANHLRLVFSFLILLRKKASSKILYRIIIISTKVKSFDFIINYIFFNKKRILHT